MICYRCRKSFQPGKATASIMTYGMPAFCSEHCLREHIGALPPLSVLDLKQLGIQRAPIDFLPKDCYSPLLNNRFRSQFECGVAERVVSEWKNPIAYEAHMVRFSPRKIYIPDFWLPANGVWFEAKGEWRLGARKKFLMAVERLGKERLLMIPPYYLKWFKLKRGRAWLQEQ